MTSITYKLSLQGYSGFAFALYKNDVLDQCINEITMNYVADNSKDMPMIPLYRQDLVYTKFTYAELVPKTVAEKVALFSLKYKQHKGQPYRAMKEEKANLKTVTVNNQLLDAYFTNINYPLNSSKSMADYVRHYNTIRDFATNGKPVKRLFPDVYDRMYEKTIGDDVVKLQAYWQHLRDIGWHKQDGIWVKKQF